MSKKNLAGTIIEGGRSDTWERRERNRVLRRQGTVRPGDDFENRPSDTVKLPGWRFAREGFNDRLNPLKRYLRSQVGKPWNDTYSTLRRKYDCSTLRNWHLVEDHAVRTAEAKNRYRTHNEYGIRYYGFYIDSDGILCYKTESEYSKEMRPIWDTYRIKRKEKEEQHKIAQAEDRKIAREWNRHLDGLLKSMRNNNDC